MNRGDRYELAEITPGALLLDRDSGAAFALNATGHMIWKSWIDGKTEKQIAATLSTRYGLDEATAERDVRRALEVAPTNVPPPETDFKYSRDRDRYTFALQGNIGLVVDDRGDQLTLAGGDIGKLPMLLQAIAPKLLALRGQPVLHAAAVLLNDFVLAVSGISRAGKSTTARALTKTRGRILCEDKMVLAIDANGVGVLVQAEKTITEWVSSAASDLASAGQTDCAGLDAATKGEVVPLAEIAFIDASRRTAGPASARPFSPPETAGAIFQNSFYGSDTAGDWSRRLESAAQIARVVRGFELTLPEGLDRLAATAARLAEAESFRS